MTTDYLTAKEVAALFRISERQVTRLAEQKRIPAFQVGKRWRFRKADLDAWASAQTVS